MPLIITATVESWDEQPIRELEDGRRLTRAAVRQSLAGGLAGTVDVEWLMAYRADGTADYTGFAVVDGSRDGRPGTMIARTDGRFDGSEATGSWDPVPGSGQGSLADLVGHGRFRAPHGSKATIELDE